MPAYSLFRRNSLAPLFRRCRRASHRMARQILESIQRRPLQFLPCVMDAEKMFEVSGGDVKEALIEPSLFRTAAGGMPQGFEGFVGLPPVGEIVEIYAVEIPFVLTPLLRWKRGKRWSGSAKECLFGSRRGCGVRPLINRQDGNGHAA